MSRKKTVYSTEFKTKLVLEVLKNDRTLNRIASENKDRKSVVQGKSVDLGGRRIIKKKKKRRNRKKRKKKKKKTKKKRLRAKR